MLELKMFRGAHRRSHLRIGELFSHFLVCRNLIWIPKIYLLTAYGLTQNAVLIILIAFIKLEIDQVLPLKYHFWSKYWLHNKNEGWPAILAGGQSVSTLFIYLFFKILSADVNNLLRNVSSNTNSKTICEPSASCQTFCINVIIAGWKEDFNVTLFYRSYRSITCSFKRQALLSFTLKYALKKLKYAWCLFVLL